MITKGRFIVFIFLTNLLLVGENVSPPIIFAQGYSLTIEPSLSEITLMPGKRTSQKYKVFNAGDDQVITLNVFPFEPTDGPGEVIPLPYPQLLKPLEFSLDNYKNFPKKKVLIKSGEEKEFTLEIFAPANTPEKDYYASLILEASPETKEDFFGSRLITQLGSPFLISVSSLNNPPKEGRISSFEAPKLVNAFEPIGLSLEIENLGKFHFEPQGEILVQGIFGQGGSVQIIPQNVLAQSKRKVKLLPINNRLFFGPFTARARMKLEGLDKEFSQEISFWVFPYKFTAVITSLFLVILLVNRILGKIKKSVTIKSEKKTG